MAVMLIDHIAVGLLRPGPNTSQLFASRVRHSLALSLGFAESAGSLASEVTRHPVRGHIRPVLEMPILR
jgi:hypothetical protein